jgi:hypothetical protein
MLLAKSTKHERVEDHDQGNQEEQGKQKGGKLKKKQITEEEEKRETTWKTWRACTFTGEVEYTWLIAQKRWSCLCSIKVNKFIRTEEEGGKSEIVRRLL